MRSRREFINLVSAGTITPVLASAVPARQLESSTNFFTQASESKGFSSIWKTSVSPIVDIIIDQSTAYVATSNSIQSYDINTGNAKDVIGSVEGIQHIAKRGQHLFAISDSSLQKYNKNGDILWQRPIRSPVSVAVTESSSFVLSGGYDESGIVQRIGSDGSIIWRSEVDYIDKDNIIAAEGDIFVTGSPDDSYGIKKLNKSTGSQIGEVTVDPLPGTTFPGEPDGYTCISGSTGYTAAQQREFRVLFRFDTESMTTTWRNFSEAEFYRDFPPVVTNNGLYTTNEDGVMSKYSKINGEVLWTAGSIAPDGVVQYSDGVLAVGVDTTTVDSREEYTTGVLASYSADGLKQWQMELGSGSLEEYSFVSPKYVPSLNSFIIGDVDQAIYLVGPSSVSEESSSNNKVTTTSNQATVTERQATTSNKNNAETAEGSSETQTISSAQSEPSGQGMVGSRDLIIPGDNLVSYNEENNLQLISVGGFIISVAGLAYNLATSD